MTEIILSAKEKKRKKVISSLFQRIKSNKLGEKEKMEGILPSSESDAMNSSIFWKPSSSTRTFSFALTPVFRPLTPMSRYCTGRGPFNSPIKKKEKRKERLGKKGYF